MTSDEDGAAILAAILADPSDDLPRLAYADWLEEAGERAHAAYVRWMMGRPHAARVPVPRVSYRRWYAPWWVGRSVFYHTGERALVVLAVRHGPGGPAADHTNRFTVRRGFVEAVGCPWHAWVRHGKALVGRQPVTRVTLTGAGDHPRELTLGPSRWGWRPGDHAPVIAGALGASYPSEAEASSALSEACLAWARDRAPNWPDSAAPPI